MENKIKLFCRVKHIKNKEAKIIKFNSSALKSICELLGVPFNPNIIAFTKRGVKLK